MIQKKSNMKNAIILLLGLIMCTTSFGQTTKIDTEELIFTQSNNKLKFDEAPELNVSRYGFGYASDDNFIYIANGGSIVFPFQNSVEKYDQSTNSWEVLDVTLIKKR